MDVRQDTTLGNCDVTQELVQLLVVTNGELQVTRDDTRLLVVTSGVTSQLENFGSQVLQDSREVDRRTFSSRLVIMSRHDTEPHGNSPAPTR